MAVCMKQLGQHEQAISAFEGLINIDPNYVNAMTSMGRSLERLGRFQEAIDIYQKALEVSKGHITAKYYLEKLGVSLNVEMDPNAINSIVEQLEKCYKFGEEKIKQYKMEGAICSICLDDIDLEIERIFTMLRKCKHVYHTECINVWMESKETCPLCKSII